MCFLWLDFSAGVDYWHLARNPKGNSHHQRRRRREREKEKSDTDIIQRRGLGVVSSLSSEFLLLLLKYQPTGQGSSKWSIFSPYAICSRHRNTYRHSLGGRGCFLSVNGGRVVRDAIPKSETLKIRMFLSVVFKMEDHGLYSCRTVKFGINFTVKYYGLYSLVWNALGHCYVY